MRITVYLISTLQDVRAHRETEMNYFNMEICRLAEEMKMQTDLSLTRTLGALTLKKG
ncbi:ketopantoate reductase C-terminal domain-containing protein [Idiomarina sp.]|uniref:ketopantoate reductase C-terminal domain-containing protein n=1 Tax=Idiomarina sp. TaxID=1874361 RepID=UPI003A94E620